MHALKRIGALHQVPAIFVATTCVAACGGDGVASRGEDGGTLADASAEQQPDASGGVMDSSSDAGDALIDASGDSAIDGGLNAGDASGMGNDADAAGSDAGLPCPEPAGTDKVIASFHPYPKANTHVVPGFHVLSKNGNVFFGVTSMETDYSYFAVPRCAGSVTTLRASTKQASTSPDRGDFAVDAQNLYYGDTAADGTFRVVQTPVGGGATTSLATSSSFVEAVASSAHSVFWTAHAPAVSQVDLASGVVTPLWTVPTDNGLHDYAFDIVADDTHVFFAGLTQLVSVPVGGGTPVNVGPTPLYFGVNSTDIFAVIDMGEGQVSLNRISKDGSSSMPIVPQFGSNQPAADDTNVYWADWSGTGNVERVSVGGGTASNFAVNTSALGQSAAIGLDEAYVYWVTFDGSGLVEIHRMDK